jgi:hypothetical protein
MAPTTDAHPTNQHYNQQTFALNYTMWGCGPSCGLSDIFIFALAYCPSNVILKGKTKHDYSRDQIVPFFYICDLYWALDVE